MKNKITFCSNLILGCFVSILSIGTGFAQDSKIFQLVENNSQEEIFFNKKASKSRAKASTAGTAQVKKQDLEKFYNLKIRCIQLFMLKIMLLKKRQGVQLLK